MRRRRRPNPVIIVACVMVFLAAGLVTLLASVVSGASPTLPGVTAQAFAQTASSDQRTALVTSERHRGGLALSIEQQSNRGMTSMAVVRDNWGDYELTTEHLAGSSRWLSITAIDPHTKRFLRMIRDQVTGREQIVNDQVIDWTQGRRTGGISAVVPKNGPAPAASVSSLRKAPRFVLTSSTGPEQCYPVSPIAFLCTVVCYEIAISPQPVPTIFGELMTAEAVVGCDRVVVLGQAAALLSYPFGVGGPLSENAVGPIEYFVAAATADFPCYAGSSALFGSLGWGFGRGDPNLGETGSFSILDAKLNNANCQY